MSALIRTGSWHDFNVSPHIAPTMKAKHGSLESMRTLRQIANATRELQPLQVELKRSSDDRGLALKSLKLMKGFDGYLRGVFNPTNEIYFVSWAWDLSGSAPFMHPATGTAPDSLIIPMKAGHLREFIGAGINLFPARKVVSGLAVRMMIWESDSKTRKLGETLQRVSKEIQESKLTNLLSLIATAASVPTATVNLVYEASLELGQIIGQVLKNNSDDYVDYYEGYYPVEHAWKSGTEEYSGNATEIVFQRIAAD